jgi:hypothetical protein
LKPIRRLTPPGPVFADDFNALVAEVERLGNLYGDGVDVEQSPTGPLLRVGRPPERLVVKVTRESDEDGSGCTSPSYSWVQQRPIQCGQWEDDPDGITGSTAEFSPAFEMAGRDVADGSIQVIEPGSVFINVDGNVVQEWLFTTGGGGGRFQSVLFNVKPQNGTGPSYLTDDTNHKCFYDGSLWASWNPTTGDDTYTAPVWVQLTYNLAVYPWNGTIGWTPATAVMLDGHSVHDCWDTGKTYDVVMSGTHYGVRPVFRCNAFGAAFRDDCYTSGPATTNAG